MKFFDHSAQDELLQAYRRATLLLLNVYTRHGLGGDETDHNIFRANMANVTSVLSARPTAADVLVSAGTASKSIEDYTHHTSTYIRARGIELERVVDMLTQTLSEVAAGNRHSISRLREIEKRLVKSQEIHDVRELRQQMVACLAEVREESAGRRRESQRLMADLESAAQGGEPHAQSGRPGPHRAPEEFGGLLLPPGQATVEDMIEKAVLEKRPLFAAVILIDHFRAIERRYSGEVATRVTVNCAQQLGKSVPHTIAARAWKRGACVVLLDGSPGAEELEREFAYDSLHRHEITLETESRSVMLALSHSKWSLFPVSGRSPSQVLKEMQGFLTSRSLAHRL
jgi:hypothetical protein